MSLEDLTETQQQMLHPLIKLKQKSSMEALGTLLDVLNDLKVLYQNFSDGLLQLESKAVNCHFITGISDQSSSDALRAFRGDLKQADETVIAITKEQKGMIAVWNAVFSLLAKTHKETSTLVSVLQNGIHVPLGKFYEEFKEGFTDSVDHLQMNDVLNFIPNLKSLKQTAGFSHCGAKKYVENVLKSYKELQHYLENEKEVVGEAEGTKAAKLQAKAVNKTVKAKISLGKHIQQLFEVAPEMKVLITKNISQDTFDRLAGLKPKKSAEPTEQVHTDIIAFQESFCKLEKRRLSIFASCLQLFAESIVTYRRNAYNNLRDVYQSILQFSPEVDYGQFEALILGAQVSHTSKHSRMLDEALLTAAFVPLEDFKLQRKPNVCMIMHQPAEIDLADEDADTVFDDDSLIAGQESFCMSETDQETIKQGLNEQEHMSPVDGLYAEGSTGVVNDDAPDATATLTNAEDGNTASVSVAEDAMTIEVIDIQTAGATGEENLSEMCSFSTSCEGKETIAAIAGEKVAVPEGALTEPHEAKAEDARSAQNKELVIISPNVSLADISTHKKHSGIFLRSANILGYRKKHGKRSCSMERLQEEVKPMRHEQLAPGPEDESNIHNASSKRSSSALPCIVRDISINLANEAKKDPNGRVEEKKSTKEQREAKSEEKKNQKKDSRKDDKKDEKKESRKDDKRDGKKESRKDDKRDEKKESRKEDKKDEKKESRKDDKRDEKKESRKDDKRDEKKESRKEDKKDEKKSSRKDEKKESKKEHTKKRGSKRDKGPTAIMTGDIEFHSSHFGANHLEPPHENIDFDFTSFSTAVDILKETQKRSNEYFVMLSRYCMFAGIDRFDYLEDQLVNPMDDSLERSFYPFDMTTNSVPSTEKSTNRNDNDENASSQVNTRPYATSIVANSPEEYNLKRLLKLQYKFEDNRMDGHQWNLVALEQLVLLHKYLSGFMTHPCLNNDQDATFKEFLLTNLGIIEHMVTRIRKFVGLFRNHASIIQEEFAVLDAALTPRDILVSTNPHVKIHEMDVRYRLVLMVDTWNKNDITISGRPLFDSSEFYDYLYRQVYLVKLSIVQKLARVIRRVPVLDRYLDRRWLEAINSENPKEVLNIQFKFEDNAKADRLSNKILFLLCECIGRLNNVISVIGERHWGKESAFDSNYMSPRDQLAQVINITVELEELDKELVINLDLGNHGQDLGNDSEHGIAASSKGNPFKMKTENLFHIRKAVSPSVAEANVLQQQESLDISQIPAIKVSEAARDFCTSMTIFNDEEVSLLRRVNRRKGCFGKCTSWRTRKDIEEDGVLNPYFMHPVEVRTLSRCWKLEDPIIMKIASLYHGACSGKTMLPDWPTNFTTIEYVIYFISTGRLLNFVLYKGRKYEYNSTVCTLYHALLSASFIARNEDTLEEAPFDNQAVKIGTQPLKNNDGNPKWDEVGPKELFTMLQVPLNLSAFPRMLEALDLYLQNDFLIPYTTNSKALMNQVTPDCSSLQMASVMHGFDLGRRTTSSRLQLSPVQLNRAAFKVQRLLVDSISHNVPMISLLKDSDSISLITASPIENWVSSILVLRTLTGDFSDMIFRNLLTFTITDGMQNFLYNLTTFFLLSRLLFPNEMRKIIEQGTKSLDIQSVLEAHQGPLTMDLVLRHIVMNNAKKLMSTVITKVEAFGVEDLEEVSTMIVEASVASIKEAMQMSRVWDEFLPAGEFATLFTNCCVHFIKKYIRYRVPKLLDVCKVMQSVHKLRLIQREIEVSRMVKTSSDSIPNVLIKVLTFSFGNTDGLANHNLFEESNDIMEVTSIVELEQKLHALKDMINRTMKMEDWNCIPSKAYTRAIVDLVTVLNATLKAILDLKIPFDKLLIPLTGSLESFLNGYYAAIADNKITAEMARIMDTLKNESGTLSEDMFKKLGDFCNLERGTAQMGNLLYLGEHLNEIQDGLVDYFHRMLTERCEGSVELHKHLGTNLYRDSGMYFAIDEASIQGIKELALIRASKRLIERQCTWHVRSLAQLYSLIELQKMALELYRPTVTHGPGLKTFLSTIKSMCTEFGKLGDAKSHALEALFEVVFCCLAYAIRSTRRLPQETGILNDDLRVLQWLASEHQQDVSQLLESTSKLII